MKRLTEQVDLPDPAVQPLVHPVDIDAARKPMRNSWLVESLTNPGVGLVVLALVWLASRNFVIPLIAGASTVILGKFTARMLRRQAWSYIPRKRQDRNRPLPLSWRLTSASVFAVLLFGAVLLLAVSLDRPEVSGGVREFVLGSGAAAVALMTGDFVWSAVRSRDEEEQQHPLLELPKVIAALGGLAIGYLLLFGSAPPASWTTVLLGTATMIGAAIVAGIGRLAFAERPTPSRR